MIPTNDIEIKKVDVVTRQMSRALESPPPSSSVVSFVAHAKTNASRFFVMQSLLAQSLLTPQGQPSWTITAPKAHESQMQTALPAQSKSVSHELLMHSSCTPPVGMHLNSTQLPDRQRSEYESSQMLPASKATGSNAWKILQEAGNSRFVPIAAAGHHMGGRFVIADGRNELIIIVKAKVLDVHWIVREVCSNHSALTLK
jgi:hypothetical protein